jgi:hypothetical protein
MRSRWIDKVVEYGSFGDAPVLVVAPHEGVELIEVEGELVRLGERGSGFLARTAAEHAGCSFIVVHVPRSRADFARDPALLGRGEKFRLHMDGRKKVWLDCHTDRRYSGVLEKFHGLIEKKDPSFLVDFHTMGNAHIDVKLGFGKRRQYIGGTGRALRFRDELKAMMTHDLNVLVSKKELTGESEFILRSHHAGRLAAMVEFSSTRGFSLHEGKIQPGYVEAAEKAAELAAKWSDQEKGSEEPGR